MEQILSIIISDLEKYWKSEVIKEINFSVFMRIRIIDIRKCT